MTRLLDQILIYLLAAAIVFGGWNWWRKNVYYTALQNVAAEKIEKARQVEAKQRDELAAQAETLKEKARDREKQLQEQLEELRRPPAERVVYRLRDRWLPVSCPAEAGTGGVQTTYGGLQPADEQFLVRLAAEADGVVDTLTACQTALKTVLDTK